MGIDMKRKNIVLALVLSSATLIGCMDKDSVKSIEASVTQSTISENQLIKSRYTTDEYRVLSSKILTHSINYLLETRHLEMYEMSSKPLRFDNAETAAQVIEYRSTVNSGQLVTETFWFDLTGDKPNLTEHFSVSDTTKE